MSKTKTNKTASLAKLNEIVAEAYRIAVSEACATPTNSRQEEVLLRDLESMYYATDVVEVRVRAARTLGGITMLQAEGTNGEDFIAIRDAVLNLREALNDFLSASSQTRRDALARR